MKHISLVDYYDGSSLEEEVNKWISENEHSLLDIIDIEYTQHGNVFLAIITYEER